MEEEIKSYFKQMLVEAKEKGMTRTTAIKYADEKTSEKYGHRYEIPLRSFEWFGEGRLTYDGEIKFYVGANIEPDEDNDIYLTAEDFRQIAKDALMIAEELENINSKLNPL